MSAAANVDASRSVTAELSSRLTRAYMSSSIYSRLAQGITQNYYVNQDSVDSPNDTYNRDNPFLSFSMTSGSI